MKKRARTKGRKHDKRDETNAFDLHIGTPETEKTTEGTPVPRHWDTSGDERARRRDTSPLTKALSQAQEGTPMLLTKVLRRTKTRRKGRDERA